MPNGDEQTLAAAKAFLDRQGLEYEEADEQYCTNYINILTSIMG
ncbi:MAG: hypothetical protein R6V55_03540 [Desulfovermiculus sp.]